MPREIADIKIHSFNQDTIQAPSASKDSLSIEIIHVQKRDTSIDTSIIQVDTQMPGKSADAREKVFLQTDSIKTKTDKKAGHTRNEVTSQGRDNDIATKKSEELSWNTPGDFANRIFTYEMVKEDQFQGLSNDTLSTYAEVQGKKSTFYKRFQANIDWIFWTYVIIALLFLWIQIFYRKYYNGLFNSSVSYHMSSKLFNERNIMARRVSVVLNFIYTVSVSLIIFRMFQYLGIKSRTFDRFSLFLIILNLIILYSLSKAIFQKIIGFVFYRLDQINEYLHNVYVYNKILGIFLLPLTFAAFYTPDNIAEILLVAAILFYIFSLIFKVIRGFQIIFKNDVLIFYSILYLCTLEILPVIIGIKLFKSLA